ncbi:MAG: hypothetical protein KAW67_10515 [Candidatus Eisenbacteria sp.]|nr:hypothetical protein [Candidatus Eisenbacteria bacterium]
MGFLQHTMARGAWRPVSALSVAAALLLGAALTPSVGQASEPARPDSADAPLCLEDVLAGYNANIHDAIAAIETLRVEQEMLEPTKEDGEKRALALLLYSRGEGMRREERSSDLGHPVGEYELRSLVGPELPPAEYDVLLTGVEDMDGRRCYRLSVTAIERDVEHFDGTVWVEVGSLGLVRILGQVADPPFPVERITLDKAFEPVPEGFRLLRRHTGEIDIRLAFVRRHGMMHIFYADYAIVTSRQSD